MLNIKLKVLYESMMRQLCLFKSKSLNFFPKLMSALQKTLVILFFCVVFLVVFFTNLVGLVVFAVYPARALCMVGWLPLPSEAGSFDSFIFIGAELAVFVSAALVFVAALLIAISYTTLIERKKLATMQRRRGPNRVGFFGLLQPFADGFKLIFKEWVATRRSNVFIFFIIPFLSFIFALSFWSVLPLAGFSRWCDFEYSLFLFSALTALTVYFTPMAGWFSRSKYSMLACLRAVSQTISYELALGTVYLAVSWFYGSANLVDIAASQVASGVWGIFSMTPVWVMFMICACAELNRVPYDLMEAESELVAGYGTEYSSFPFAMFFLAEYNMMLVFSALATVLFFAGGSLFGLELYLGTWSDAVIFSVKTALHFGLMVWMRASVPRFRYDQLLKDGWKVYLPIASAFALFYGLLLPELCLVLLYMFS